MPSFLNPDFLSDMWKSSNEWIGMLANLIGVGTPVVGLAFLLKKMRHAKRESSRSDKRLEINKKMTEPAYLAWVQRVVMEIYAGLEFVSIYNRKHPAVIFRPARPFTYPFADLCSLRSTQVDTVTFNRQQEQYIALLGDSVKRPKMKGFATEEILVENGGVSGVIARTATYEQNLVTAHILEWELFLRYSKKKTIDADILSDLPLRSAYHGGRPSIDAVLKPANAYPLISVQALVIYKDYKDPANVVWKAVVAQRQKNVAIKPELWQIPPAGGFEIYGNEDDNLDIQLIQGFDVRSALFREYAEELYNVEEMAYCSDGRDSGSILSEQHVSHLIKLIHSGRASMDFLGIIADLTILRHELSFLILIDDEEYSGYPILGSSESKKIFSMNLAELKRTFSTQNVHSSSAGLLQLAIESDRLRKAGISDVLTA